MKMTFIERVAANIDKKIRTNDVLVLTIGAMTALGTMVKEKGSVLEIDLKTPAIIEEGGKIAVSRKESGRWRLIGYATPEK